MTKPCTIDLKLVLAAREGVCWDGRAAVPARAGSPPHPREEDVVRALVLGGSSFVGGRLVGRLLESGAEVSTLNRGKSGAARAGVRQLTADRRDAASMREALAGGEWDAVFDVSGYVMATDAENFAALVGLLDGRAGRYVFVSSVMAYQPIGFFPWYETGEVRSESPTTYGGFKVFAERTLLERHRSTGLSVAITRPAAIYGPENNIYDMETAMFLRLRGGLPILVPHRGLVATSYGHVDDYCAALLVAATHPAADGEIFNVTGLGVTARQYVDTLAGIVGAEPDVVMVPDDVLDRLDRPPFSRLFLARHHGIASTAKAQSVLGLPPERDFTTGHRQTYEWFLASPLAAAAAADDPLWGKGFDLEYEQQVVGEIRDRVQGGRR
jgi:nucleoside-diphosphate-sugar epimerase